MQLREFVGFHSGTNNLTFLQLYKLRRSVSGYRRFDSRFIFKTPNAEDYSARWRYNHHFSSKCPRN
jgi:hypothetical protein